MGKCKADAIALAVLAWQAGAGAQTPAREQYIDTELAKLLDEERRRQRQLSRSSCVAGAAGQELRAVDVVSADVAAELEAARKRDVPVMEAYFTRAMAAPPVLEQLQVKLAGRQYSLPRVTLTAAATDAELAAMPKLYPTRRLFGKTGALDRRWRNVLEQIGMGTDYLVVDGTGCASGVVARNVYSDAGLVGKRVLLLLNARIGLGRGFAKVCMGSGMPTYHELLAFVKDAEKLGCWGLPRDATPVEYVLNGATSGRLVYKREGKVEASYQCGARALTTRAHASLHARAAPGLTRSARTRRVPLPNKRRVPPNTLIGIASHVWQDPGLRGARRT